MPLNFPTFSPLPLYPTAPTEGDEAALNEFFNALRNFFEQLFHQHTTTRRYFEAAGFYCNDANSDNTSRTQSQAVAQEAISAVIRNIVPHTKREYVWDAAQQRWVWQSVQIS
jgi:hypothetical protein